MIFIEFSNSFSKLFYYKQNFIFKIWVYVLKQQNIWFIIRIFNFFSKVSFFSTSSELSNKQRFEFFLRTVPSDKSQASAMVEIVKKLNWTYVSIIYEESIYGIRVSFKLPSNICVKINFSLNSISIWEFKCLHLFVLSLWVNSLSTFGYIEALELFK